MMLLLLHCITLALVISSVNGLAGMAIVPPSPSSAEDSSDCLDTCFRSSALIETAFDLANFQDIARHSNNFCVINTAMKACVALCSEREKRQAVERGRAAEYFCGRKKALLDRIGKCLSSHSNNSNVVEGCAEDCGLPFGHGPIRLDSSPSAMINPSVFLDGIETTCKREICIIRCSSDSLERMCTEAGKLFRDAARFQIQIGAAKLAAEATSTSQPDLIIHASPPASRPVGFDETQEREFAMQTGSLGDFVHKFIAALPNECRFVYNASDFDKAVDTIDLNAVMAQAHLEEAPFNEGSPFETAELSSDEPLGPPTPAQFRNFTAEEEALKLKELSTISPDVPIGSPDKSDTTELPANMDIVTGQQETDEKIIDMTGHEVNMNMIPTTLPTVSDDSSENMSVDDTDTMSATGRAELQNNEDSMPINTNSIDDIESSQMVKENEARSAEQSSVAPSVNTMTTDVESGKHMVAKKPKEKKLVVCSFGSAICLFILVCLAIALAAFCGYWLTKQEYDRELAHLHYFPLARRNYSNPNDDSDEENDYDDASLKELVPSAAELKLPDTFNPVWYNLTLKINLPGYVDIPKDKEFTTEGKLLVKIKTLKESDEIVLNARSLKFPEKTDGIKIMKDGGNQDDDTMSLIDEARSKREVSDVQKIWTNETLEKVFIKLNRKIPSGEEFILELPYSGMIDDSLEGFFRSKYTTKDGQNRTIAISHLQPNYNRKLLPSFDEPQLKANWKLTIIHPKGTIARSNGMEIMNDVELPSNETEVDSISSDWKSTTFEETPLISSYLMGLTITDFTHVEAKTKSGTTVRVWARPEATEAGITKYSLTKAVEAFDFLEDYYQIPQPMKKQDLFAVPDFEPGAMENPGILMFREARLVYDEKNDTPETLINAAVTVSHEVSHQWFGDLVTLSGWDSLWLNEAFATYMSFFLEYFARRDTELAFDMDELASSHPLTMKIDTAADAYEIFDGITYFKGASIVRMIKAIMGEEAFRKGVQEYIKSHAFGNANYTDLWKSFTSALPNDAKTWNGDKLDIEKFANPWILQMGYPVIDVYRLDANTVELSQRRFKLNNLTPEKAKFRNALYWYKWDVPIFYEINGNRQPMKWLHEALRLPLNLNDTMIINGETEGFYRVNYDDETWQRISDQLDKDYTVYSPMTRLRILSDVFALASAEQQPYELALNISKYLSKETHPYPYEKGVNKILGVYGRLASEDNDHVKDLLKSLISPEDLKRLDDSNWESLIDENPENLLESSRVGTHIKIYCALESRKCRDKLLSLFNEKLVIPCKDQKIASDCTLLLLNILNPTTSIVKKQDIHFLLASMNSNPVGREITTNFLIDNWGKVVERLKEDRDILTLLIRNGVELGNARELKQMKQFLSDHKRTTRGFGTFKTKMDQARGKIQWNKLHSKEILQYLDGKMAQKSPEEL